MKALTALVSLVLATGAQAQTAKEKSELSEQCGKQAKELFEKERGTGVSNLADGWQINNYENHYNFRLNKCFYLETSNIWHRDKPAPSDKLMKLLDLHENRQIAIYSKIERNAFVACLVQDKQCKSEEEWRALIKPFMED